MAAAVHDSIVVCRPEQLREAAVVLSCCPADRFTPLIVVERPPIGEQQYRALYDAYVEVRNRRDALTGGPLGRQQARRDSEQALAANREVDRKAQALTPYRSWWRHQRLVAGLLQRLPIKRAVFLFDDTEDIRLIDALPLSRIGDSRLETIPPSIERIFLCGPLSGLADAAWRALRPGTSPPPDGVEVSEADASRYFMALSRALGLGIPLRPRPGRVEALVDGAPGAAAASEAVLIEISDDAAKLLGVQYAHHRKARLVVYPQPGCSRVEEATAGLEAKRAAAKAASAKRSPLRALGEYLFGDAALAEAIGALEREVAAVVPDEVVSAVGDLDLTAFTSGIPYSFLKKKGADWSSKAIGHVAGDASLLVLTEMCAIAEGVQPGFSLIFDPGFFATSETRDVLSVLQKRLSYPLVLEGAAASSLALLQLGESMAIDFLFFNTHGSDHEIQLSDGPLPAFKLVQRQALRSRPFVFNSSCLSWVGVGREFVRAGARGYLGTLWSIDAQMAARYAHAVLERAAHGGRPVSAAMHDTGTGRSHERAYIFVGTCAARLAEMPLTGVDAERRELVSTVQALLENAASAFRRSAGHADIPFLSELGHFLRREAERLLADYDRRWPTAHLDRAKLSILQLVTLSSGLRHRRTKIPAPTDIVDETRRVLQNLPLEPKVRFAQLARLLQIAGRIASQLGDKSGALDLLSSSMRFAEQADESPPAAGLELCDALRRLGRNEEAFELAAKLNAAYAAQAPQLGQLGSLGRLAQLAQALHRHADALRYARQGFDLATRLDEPAERAAFKGDETRALEGLVRLDEASDAALQFLHLARQAYDAEKELAAYGLLAEVLIGKRELDQALHYVQSGLEQARARGSAASMGDFLMNMHSINTGNGDPIGAIDSAMQAAAAYAAVRDTGKLRNALGYASQAYERLVLQNRQANTWDALSRLIAGYVEVVDAADRSTGSVITTDVVQSVKDLVKRVGVAPLREALEAAARDALQRARARPPRHEDQLLFIARALQLFADVAAERFAEAVQVAVELDGLSAGGFELLAFVDASARAAKPWPCGRT